MGLVFTSRSQATAQNRPEPKEAAWKDFVCDLSLLGWGQCEYRYGDVLALVHT